MMKVRELIEIVDEAMDDNPKADPARTAVMFARQVEANDVEWTETFEVGDLPDAEDADVGILLDIDDFEAVYPVVGVRRGRDVTVEIDTERSRAAKTMTVEEFVNALRSAGEDADVVWRANGEISNDWYPVAKVDWVGNVKTGRKQPFPGGGSDRTSAFSVALILQTDSIDSNPPFEAVRQYADKYREFVREKAAERLDMQYSEGPNDWRGGDGWDD